MGKVVRGLVKTPPVGTQQEVCSERVCLRWGVQRPARRDVHSSHRACFEPFFVHRAFILASSDLNARCLIHMTRPHHGGIVRCREIVKVMFCPYLCSRSGL